MTKVGIAPGTQLPGNITIVDYINRGGMAHVYKVDRAGQTLALKQLAPSDNFGVARDLFVREGKMLTKFNNPNIVKCFGTSQVDEEYFILMEYVPGQNLLAILQSLPNHRLDTLKVLDYMIQLCNALRAMHRLGIVHRDIKPDNAIVNGNNLKLTDFGLSREMSDPTQTVINMGSLGFESPEHRFRDVNFGSYTDAYSVGATMACALIGETPPSVGPDDEIFENRVQYVCDRIADTDVRAIVKKAMTPDALKRYQHMDEMIEVMAKAYKRRGQLPQHLQTIANSVRPQSSRSAVIISSSQSGILEQNPSVALPQPKRSNQQPPINPSRQQPVAQTTTSNPNPRVVVQRPTTLPISTNPPVTAPSGTLATGNTGGLNSTTTDDLDDQKLPKHPMEIWGAVASAIIGGAAVVIMFKQIGNSLTAVVVFGLIAYLAGSFILSCNNGLLTEPAPCGTKKELSPGLLGKMFQPKLSIPVMAVVLVFFLLLSPGSSKKQSANGAAKPKLQPITAPSSAAKSR